MKLYEFAEDRYVRSAIAGVVAGIHMNLTSFFTVSVFNIGEDLASDYMTEMLLGRQALIPLEKLSLLLHSCFLQVFWGSSFLFHCC